ncbi:MAG: type II secretion system protein [Fervidobacterium sp.]|uniref:type II secretion system protein n=1 Tax=Fervidobacterium sp. TaxID=1871331 RepID=UPI00404ADBCC
MRKGFTLVELLIVLAVIAALMAVATPLALNAVRNAKASQVAQNFRNLKAAIENYYNTEKPSDLGNLEPGSLTGYINAMPSNFQISGATPVDNQPGLYEVAVTYTGQDVEIARVQANGMNEVTAKGDNIELKFRIQKWW